jgi:lipid-binding SYLF domain-containing protein
MICWARASSSLLCEAAGSNFVQSFFVGGCMLIKKLSFFILVFLAASQLLYAASKEELNIEIRETIKLFNKEVKGGARFLHKSKGYLVFPNVYKAGFGIGGEYGEGALLVGGRIVDYYNTVAASFGFQIGAQRKSVIIVFLTHKALKDFIDSDGWKVGADASVAFVKWGLGEDVNTIDFQDPVVGFIFSNEGLMYNLTLEGSKITKIKK